MRSAGLGRVTPEVMAIGSNVTPSGSPMSEDGVASCSTTTGCACSATIPSRKTATTDKTTPNRRMMAFPYAWRRPTWQPCGCFTHELDLRSLSSGPWPGCGGGERAELLQDPQVVPVAADNVCNLALGNAQRRRPGPGHCLARRWHCSDRACPFPLVGACGDPDSGNHVILGKLIVDGDPVIGKSSAHLGRDIQSRRQQLRSEDVLPEVQLSLVVERLEVLANEGLVLVLRGGHGPASCQGSSGTCSPIRDSILRSPLRWAQLGCISQ